MYINPVPFRVNFHVGLSLNIGVKRLSRLRKCFRSDCIKQNRKHNILFTGPRYIACDIYELRHSNLINATGDLILKPVNDRVIVYGLGFLAHTLQGLIIFLCTVIVKV